MTEEKVDYRKIIEEIKPELEKAVRFLEGELKKIRAQRASADLVEDMEVECFGQKFPLKQLALISVPQPREIVIQPWDQSYIEGILKAFEKSGLGVSAVVDRNVVRVNFPPLSEEFRKNLIRLVSQKKEMAKKTIRNWREEAWNKIQQNFREGKISEDDKYRGKEKLQDLIDEYNEKIEEMTEKKEKEILGA
jgi:ribosome recycling factor